MGIYKEKIVVAFDALEKNKIDLWIIAGQESATNSEPMISCLGDFEFIGLTALIFDRAKRSSVICTPIDADGYERLNTFDEVISFPVSFVKTLSDFLREKSPNKIALDYSLNNPASDGLTVGIYSLIKEALELSGCKAEIVSAEPLVSLVRGIKSEDEIARIKKACEKAEKIFDDAKGFIKAGMNCQDVYRFFQDQVKQNNYAYSWPSSCNPGVSSGKGCPSGHMGAPDFLISKGDLINIDFGIIVDGYGCDLQRMYYVLDDNEVDAPEDIKEAFNTVRDAIAKAAKVLIPGVTGYEVDKVARDYIVSCGFPEWNAALGHQIGRVAHDGGALLAPERPRYNRPELIHSPLHERFVFTLEPSIPTQRGRIGLEEDVVVRSSGAEFLTPPQQSLYLI